MKQENIGRSIAMLRKEKDWTQEELGQKLGVSAQAVSKWETGQALPDITLLPEIAALFEVSMDAIFDYQPELTVQVRSASEKKDPNSMLFRIHILSSDGDRVSVNLPLSLVRVATKSKNSKILSFSNKEDKFPDLDWDEIFQLIDEGVMGKIVEVDSSDGDHIEIFVS